MAKKILSFFYIDWQWKLISLGLAVVIWLVAMHLHDPLENRSFSRELHLLNQEILERDNLVLLNEDELRSTLINLGIRGYRSDFMALAAADQAITDIFVDMRAVSHDLDIDGPVIVHLPVSFNLLAGFERQHIHPATVEVELDILDTKSVTVEVVELGQVGDGFELISALPVNRTVRVTGAGTFINMIAAVRVEVDLANTANDIEHTASIAVFDHDDNDITGLVQLSVLETTVHVRVLPVRQFELRVVSVGQVASGLAFDIDEIPHSYRFIEVVGTAERFDELEYIGFEYIELSFDVNGLAESTKRLLTIGDALPNGISLSQNAPVEVPISVTVESLGIRPFNVPFGDIAQMGVGVLHDVISPPAFIRVLVSGRQSVVNAMSVNDITVILDLRNRGVGVQWVPLTANLPEGVTLAEGLQSLHIHIYAPALDEPDENLPLTTPIPEPTPSPEPTPTPTPYPTPTPDPTPTPTPTPYENGNGENGNGSDPTDDPINGPTDDNPNPPDEPHSTGENTG